MQGAVSIVQTYRWDILKIEVCYIILVYYVRVNLWLYFDIWKEIFNLE